MRRRAFIEGIGALVVAWPLATRAQQAAMPVIGFLVSASEQGYAWIVGPVREGLKQAGFVEGENLTIEYRWADYHYDRLPKLAAELVQRQVSVIFTTGSIVSALAAKSATSSIPIVFANGSDPVRYGLVASLNHPGGNMTGITFYNSGLGPKRIGLLREILPKAAIICVLINPKNPNADDDAKDMLEAGQNVHFAAAHYVCFWHKADMAIVLGDVRFWGVKRTCCGRALMSAFDPKRTCFLRASVNVAF